MEYDVTADARYWGRIAGHLEGIELSLERLAKVAERMLEIQEGKLYREEMGFGKGRHDSDG